MEPGPSTLTVLLYNSTEYTAQNVALSPSEKQAGQQIGDIAPGGSAKFEYEMVVSQKALNTGGVDVFVSCTLNGQRLKQQLSAPVRQVAALAEAEFSRRATTNVVRPGEEMKFTYTLRNTGAVGLENVVIFDSLDNYSFPTFALEPGETRELTRTVAVESNAVSRVSASFTSALSGSQYFLYAEELAVSVRGDDVRVKANEGALPYGQAGTLRLEIENAGLYNYTAMTLSEPTLGRIPFMPASLRAGETTSVDIALPAQTEEREYRFVLTLRDENGAVCALQVDPVKVAVMPMEEKDPCLVARVTPATDAEGEVAFMLTLSAGSQSLRNVEIGERSLGALRTLAVVPAAQETEIYLACRRTTDGQYAFSASYEQDGATQTIYAEPLTAAVAGSAEEKGLNALEVLVISVVQKLNLTRGVAYACAGLLGLAVLIGAALLVRGRVRRQRKLKSVTSKFVPVHAKGNAKEME